MASVVHKVFTYDIQVLSKRTGESPRPAITVRLYTEAGRNVGTCVFKQYGESDAELPVGHDENENVTAFFDISFFDAFASLLRLEDELYWKVHWIQTGAQKEVADVSLDTKEEIIGDFFARD